MIVVLYDPINGIAIPEGRVHELVDKIVRLNRPGSRFPIMVDTANHLTVNRFRLAVVEGMLSHEELLFKYVKSPDETIEIKVNTDGKLSHWPDGFCDHLMKLSARLAKR